MLLALAALLGDRALAQPPASALAAVPTIQRVAPEKPARTVLHDGERRDVVVIKFQEGTNVRLKNGELRARLDTLRAKDTVRRGRLALDDARIHEEVARVSDLAEGPSRIRIVPMFDRPAKQLERDRDAGESRSGEELADLQLYYKVLIDGADTRSTEELIDDLNAMGVVEIAYAEPIGSPAAADIAPTTGSFVPNQGYLRDAPAGIGATTAHQFHNARGQNIRIIDIELNWGLGHEDLDPAFHVRRPFYSNDVKLNIAHGSGVLGVMVARENAYGMTGIAHRASHGVIPAVKRVCIPAPICFWTDDMANAIDRASAQLRPGDILVLEMHYKGPDSGQSCACNCAQHEFMPAEYWQGTFDAIRSATARGIVVVEAAGNGGMDLDAPRYKNKFNLDVRDSGAILVGAGTSGDHSPTCFTNFGSRIDAQGWGENVATLGGGDLAMANGNDDRQFYTASFNGTSSATPIVAGAAAALQSYRINRLRPLLLPGEMRDLFRRSGTPQPAGTAQTRIGRLPDLPDAIAALGDGACKTIYPSSTAQRDVRFLQEGMREYCFTVPASGMRLIADTCDSDDDDAHLQSRIQIVNAAGTSMGVWPAGLCGWGTHLNTTLPGGNYRLRITPEAGPGTHALTYRKGLNLPPIDLPTNPLPPVGLP
jgi:subtilisin family serine protease